MISITNLSHAYNANKVLDSISLDISAGEFVSLLGPSGVGKSTLLKLIASLLKPQSGTLMIQDKYLIKDDQVANKKDILQAIEPVGVIFQDFNLFPNLDVLSNCVLSLDLKQPSKKKEHLNKALSLLEQFNIIEKKDAFPDQLSGGQKQRVAIVRCLMLNPSLLLVDEATSALDPQRKKEFMDILCELHDNGITIVLVTHDHDLAYRYSSRVVQLEAGRITSDEVL